MRNTQNTHLDSLFHTYYQSLNPAENKYSLKNCFLLPRRFACHFSDSQIWQDIGNQMLDGFAKNNLLLNGYSSYAELFQTFVDSVSLCAQFNLFQV